MSEKFATVAEYAASLPPASARVLSRVRRLVKKAVPKSREKISYNIPAFELDRTFMYFAVFKAHVSVFPPMRADARLARALTRYRNARGNLRFPLDEPVPYALIGRVARALARQCP